MAVLFIPREPGDETRVAATPDSVAALRKRGLQVTVEPGAGLRAGYRDEEYSAAGATVGAQGDADVRAQIHLPALEEIGALREGSSLLSFLWAPENPPILSALAARRISAFSLDGIPRTTRAQAMDVLSSQASIAGYRAVIAAAARLPRILPLMMTPAGTIRPARFVVVGVGVAGLQAIATARRLGAVVEATDPRPETKEQAASLGARFLEVKGVEARKGEGGYAAEQGDEYRRAQAALLAEAFARADAIVTTALVPYRRAPITVTADHVRSMRPGSVVVDLAASRGGNCELTEPGKAVERQGVWILGEEEWARTVPAHASDMLARNVQHILLDALDREGAFAWRLDDEIVAAALVTHGGEIRAPGRPR